MDEFSRVKKYEKLRDTIGAESASKKDIEDAFKEYHLKDNDKQYQPTHEKNFSKEESISDHQNNFNNEYLDSFIQEVRDYNIRKGIREHEDTKLDILQQLSSKNKDRRSKYIEKINDDTAILPSSETEDMNSETVEISKQVLDLLNEDRKIETVQATINEEQIPSSEMTTQFVSLEERIASLESQLNDGDQSKDSLSDEIMNQQEEPLSEMSKRELLEQTMQLKVQIDEYKDELEDLNHDVNNNNRLLNIIITILIIALLAVIGVVVYWLIIGGVI